MDQQAVHNMMEPCGNDFFDRLQDHLHTTIPIMIKNILLVNDIDRALLLAEFDDKSITHVEKSMREQFDKDSLAADEQVTDFLGKFQNCQAKFVLSYGQKLMIKVMADACREIIKQGTQGALGTQESSVQGATPSNVPVAASVLKELVTNLSAEDAFQLKEQLLDSLIASLSVWINNATALSQVREHYELRFKVVRNSYMRLEDGTITCKIGCPVPNCRTDCPALYKSYKSSYKPKKKSPEKQRRLPPKWHIFAIERHMTLCHGDKIDGTRSSTSPLSSDQLPSDSSEQETVSLTDHEANGSIENQQDNLTEDNVVTVNEEVGSQPVSTRTRKKRVIPNLSNSVTKIKRMRANISDLPR